MRRFFLIARTAEVDPPRAADGATVSPLGPEHAAENIALLVDAYRDSPDPAEPGEDDADEVPRFWAGVYGQPIPELCVGVWSGDQLVAASLVSRQNKRPNVCFLVVEPGRQGQGLGTLALRSSATSALSCDEAAITLFCHPDNCSALRLYANLGFRLYAEGCVTSEGIAYSVQEQFAALHAQFDRNLPDVEVPTTYGVLPYLNRSSDHRLPGRILAAVTGYRSGNVRIPMTQSMLDAAIALLSPAEAATIFEHPNLAAWRAIRREARTEFVAQFGDTVT